VETETREAPRGSEHSFAPGADIVEKFRKLTRAMMPKHQQDALIEATLAVETLADSRELIRLLRVSA
jgi:2-methylcitrate dehydratase PrpD